MDYAELIASQNPICDRLTYYADDLHAIAELLDRIRCEESITPVADAQIRIAMLAIYHTADNLTHESKREDLQ